MKKNHRSSTHDAERYAPWLNPKLLAGGATLTLLAMAFLPSLRENQTLFWSFIAAAGLLAWWQVMLFVPQRKKSPKYVVEPSVVTAHWVQALNHSSLFLYWGWYWQNVYDAIPLILGQVVFLYGFDLLLSLSRRGKWSLGFGPMPIVFSTNLFLWFKEDWFYLQFVMIAIGALAKEFFRWTKDGKSAHIFNPSGFSLSVCSILLILTGTTEMTWGPEVSTTFGAPPYIYVWVFSLGLIVQSLFGVTLMTLAAASTLVVLNLIYTQVTGVYFFIDANIPSAVFLGLHLLITDPSTSPKTHVGRLLFGGLYGLSIFVLYGALAEMNIPRHYDKLLFVPVLNLCVQAIDRLAKQSLLGTCSRWLDTIKPRRLNYLSMVLWTGLFAGMLSFGFVESKHPGESLDFWQQECEAGNQAACEQLMEILDHEAALGSSEAFNRLGIILLEGKITQADPDKAIALFAEACDRGDLGGCANLIQHYYQTNQGNIEAVNQALDSLEEAADRGEDGQACFLVGMAYSVGRFRPHDPLRASELFAQGCDLGWTPACVTGAMFQLQGGLGEPDGEQIAALLESACAAGHAPSCVILADMYGQGNHLPKDARKSREYYQKACDLGDPKACEMLKLLDQPQETP